MALRALFARRTYRNVGFNSPSSRLGLCLDLQWRRFESTAAPLAAPVLEPPKFVEKEGWLFVDSIFPVQLGTWDLRHYIARYQQEGLVRQLSETLKKVQTNGFEVLEIEPRLKDGGVFVKYKALLPSDVELDKSTIALRDKANDAINKAGGIRTWLGSNNANIWTVRGKPWKEDMARYASRIIKVQFEGPDVYQESLYDLLRPFGKISDITNPVPVAAGVLRSSTVTFSSVRAAARAHNCIHGFTLVDEPAVAGSTTGGKPTRLATIYEKPIKAHAIRDWISGHPRIIIPVLVFILGALSYTIFEPIRVFSVQVKVTDWLDWRETRTFHWVNRNVLDRIKWLWPFSLAASEQETEPKSPIRTTEEEDFWKDRKEAERQLITYLSDAPSTVAFVHGPLGSGKTSMLKKVLKQTERRALIIDCNALNKAGSDVDVIGGLAKQTGYWPIFTWMNSFGNLIDLASVGLIGQKAGLTSSVDTQLKEILDVVGKALSGITEHYHDVQRAKQFAEATLHLHQEGKRQRMEEVRQGFHHDGRVDAVAGVGVISELGMGVEKFRPNDVNGKKTTSNLAEKTAEKTGEVVEQGNDAAQASKERSDSANDEKKGWTDRVQGAMTQAMDKSKEGAVKVWDGAKGTVTNIARNAEELEKDLEESIEHRRRKFEHQREVAEEIKALPVVVIKNFATKTSFTEQLVTVLAEWSASLAEGGVAHVIVLSDNRENGRRLAKALPATPLQSIQLSDADPASALAFVSEKFGTQGAPASLSTSQKINLEKLGGRSSDLQTLIHKVRSGMTVEEAVEDIVTRGVSELRKNAFGEESEDIKSMAWSREQAFFILKELAKSDELQYYDVLIDFPFKGDDAALRAMEHAELISITTYEGRPATIRPGRPVYRHVFERLVNDATFRAVQDIALNEKAIASAESSIKSCEEELLRLEQIRPLDRGLLSSGATQQRAAFLLKRMRDAETKLEKLEGINAKLKKSLKVQKK